MNSSGQPKKLIPILKKMEATEAEGWKYAQTQTCCPGDDWADGYNQALKDVIKIIEND